MFLANKLNKGAGVPAPVDAQFNYVTMLLHGDGTNGAQNNTFLDSSTNNFTITRNGNTTQGSFSPYGSNWSNFFDRNGDYLSAPTSVITASGDFTIECWINASSSSSNSFVLAQFTSGSSGRTGFGLGGNLVQMFLGGSTNNGTTTIPYGVWTHLAFTRSGTTFKAYVNGTLDLTVTSSVSIDQVNTTIGGDPSFSPALYFGGYISNMRVTNTVVYTSNFTPSTTPLTAISGTQLLTCQTNQFKDNSTNNYALTVNGETSVQRFNPFGTATAYSTSVIGGSGYFDGSGDYLTAANTTALDLPADFTVEFWVYLNSTSDQSFVGKWSRPSGVDQFAWIVQLNSSNLRFFTGNSGAIGTGRTFSWSPVTGTWYYIAITRSGSSLRAFINGIQVGSTVTETNNLSSTSSTSIGINLDGNIQPTNGYISSVRVVKGTALYTTTFTPPTAPLTAVTNTQLLTNFTNAAIFDNAMMNDLETVGNAQISTSVVKYGTGSLAFDGTGDYLYIPNTPSLRLSSTGAFTIEFWVNPSALSSDQHVIHAYNNSSPNPGWAFGFGSGGVANTSLAFYDGGSWRTVSTGFSTGTWYHIAVSSQGSSNTGRLFLNGVQQGSAFSVSSSIANSATPIAIGAQYTGSFPFNGYIDDLRITNGYARYTANFTPPTAAFPNIGPV
jgi:hypothetical protein